MTNIGIFAYGEMGKTALVALLKNFNVLWVLLPPVKYQTEAEKLTQEIAEKNKISIIYETSTIILQKFIEKNLPDIVLICSFNKVLSEDTLKLVSFINVHLGDLPRYRGRANVNWAIINGENKITISIHKVTPDLDGGNIYAKYPIEIKKSENVGDVYKKINKKLENVLTSVLNKILGGHNGIPQKGEATYCITRLPEDGLIDWNKTTREIYNLIRGVTKPYPGAFTYLEGKKMIVWSSRIPKKTKKYVGRIPGRVIQILQDGVEVLTSDSSIIIESITYDGKEQNASKLIKSVKTTLGIDIVTLFEKLAQ